MKLWRCLNESDVYEREKDFSIGADHVAAYDYFHAGQFPVQYCGQLFCGENQRARR